MILWAAALFFAVSVAMLVALQVYSARDVDEHDRERVEAIVRNGVATYVAGSSRNAVPQAYWDDAVVNLDHRLNRDWARVFLGNYLADTAGISTVLVADRADRFVFAHDRGRDVEPAGLGDLTAKAKPLLDEVREGERARGPLPPLPLAEGFRLQPIVAYDLVERRGRILLLSATLVQPDDIASPRAAQAPVIITAEDLNTQLADMIRDQFLLEDASLHIGRGVSWPGNASVAIRDRRGAVLATLEWRSARPGSALLRETRSATALFAVLLALLMIAFVGWGRRLAKALVTSEAEAAKLAFRDSLTGLGNRAQFGRALAGVAAAGHGGTFALLCIDLDHFKSVNDSLGHAAGDELICAVARRLVQCCGEDDRLVRFGGDEFVILQARASEPEAVLMAGRIATALAQPMELSKARVFTSASIGIAIGDPTRLASEWLRRADLALYAAKARGRGSYAVFHESMDEGVRERQELNTRLHEALGDGRLALAYQPQVDRAGRVVGLEALARWTEPDLGPVPPTTFVELAEESGLIDTLGMFAIQRAFVDSRRWPETTVAINVSALQLRQADFAERIALLVKEEGVDPVHFEFEITEGVLLGEDTQTMASIHALRDQGFRIALDDFGTGYSNLSSLQRYPIDKVKIDRSFVARIGNEPNAEAMIIALVRLARAMDLEVIAEGVETEAQRLCLLVAGCNDVQGFLTGAPMSVEEAEAMIRDKRSWPPEGGDPYGNRTRVSAVKGPRPNR